MDAKEINAQVIDAFRDGRDPQGMHRDRLLLLTTTGRRSGQKTTTPMMFHRDDGRLLVIASNKGAPADPDWYLNLAADPQVDVEVGAESYPAIATTLTGLDRDAAWQTITALYPFFADHQAGVSRTIPVVALTRV